MEDDHGEIMASDDSNDEHVKYRDREYFELSQRTPLKSIIQQIVHMDDASNMTLTSPQIISILKQEFKMDVAPLHKLELTLYMNVIKKFLKNWPRWEYVECTLLSLKRKKAFSRMRIALVNYSKELKQYLKEKLDCAKPIAKNTINQRNLKIAGQMRAGEDFQPELDIHSTRKIFNTRIFNRPQLGENNRLFNMVPHEPRIHFVPREPLTFASILHWYKVKLTIDLPFFQLERTTELRMKQFLLFEAKTGPKVFNKLLSRMVCSKYSSACAAQDIEIDHIKILLNKLMDQYKDLHELDMLVGIIGVIKNDLSLESQTVKVPGRFKHYMSRYPYFRRLHSELDQVPKSRRKLYMEQLLTPGKIYRIHKFQNTDDSLENSDNLSWLKLECGMCKITFIGDQLIHSLREHFNKFHCYEPDWSCSNCLKVFPMATLTNQAWYHIC